MVLRGAASGNHIGADIAGGANRVAFNQGDGILLVDITTVGNTISANSIFGNAISQLSPVAADDDGGGDRTSLVTFNTQMGATYQIVVDGSSGDSGNIELNIRMQ